MQLLYFDDFDDFDERSRRGNGALSLYLPMVENLVVVHFHFHYFLRGAVVAVGASCSRARYSFFLSFSIRASQDEIFSGVLMVGVSLLYIFSSEILFLR